MGLTRRNFNKIGMGAIGASMLMANNTSQAQDPEQKAYGMDPKPNPDYELPEGDHEAIRAEMKEKRRRDPRPNVLWIMTDQQQWDLMGCAGNKKIHTPHIDRLARKGIRFTESYCPSPVCGPSRGSMVTGRMPHDTRVFHNGDPLSLEVPTIGEILRKEGYRTWWSGKWHIPEARLYVDADVRGFHNIPLPKLPKSFLGDCQDMLFAGQSHDWLVWHAGLFSQPWFHATSLINPHDICYWPWTERDWAIGFECKEYENVDTMPPVPQNLEIPNDEADAVGIRRNKVNLKRTDTAWRAYNADYACMTETVDRAIGMVLEGARKGGWLENTLIIFTSDHGDGGGSHKLTGKVTCYDEAAKVPMIIVPPGGLDEGRVDQESLVSGVDIAPTIFDYAGMKTMPETHGRSLRGAVEGKGPVQRDYVVMHVAPGSPKKEETRKIEGRVIRSKRYKYAIYNWGEKREMLFDLQKDPGEMQNLAPDSRHAHIIKDHRAMFNDWKKQTGDPFQING
ncbi:MAG: sulfatase [bacterium]